MAKKLTQNVYSYKQYRLTECSKFLYEVSLYKIWKDRSESIDSQFYASEVPLKVKEATFVKMKDYTLARFVTWLGAPADYLKNNFKLITDEGNRRKRKPRTKTN
jgi:hypothetical protein